MAGIIYDSSKIKAYENLRALCNYAGEPEEWCDSLWMEMVQDEELYGEFLFYMKRNTLLDGMQCCGYTLSELLNLQMKQFNLLHDTAKNAADCSEVGMVLRAFDMMAKMKRDPGMYRKRFGEDSGADQK